MMGCDIHSYAEKKIHEKWECLGYSPFDWRAYGMYAFLAGVRNYSAITPIAEPRGIPEERSERVSKQYKIWDCDAHSASWLSVEELEKFDYDQIIEDRRCMRNNNGGSTCEIGEGQKMTYRAFLGEGFFMAIAELKEIGADRIVFWFDN